MKLDPNYAEAYNNWGVALDNLGRHEEAIEKYGKAVELDPKYASAYSNWGLALADLGRREEAVEKFEEFLRLAGGRYPEPEGAARNYVREHKK